MAVAKRTSKPANPEQATPEPVTPKPATPERDIPKPETPEKSSGTVRETLIPAIKTPVHLIPDGLPQEKTRVLLRQFTIGKLYAPGALVLISNEPIPEVTSSGEAFVIDEGIAELLDRSGVTGPLDD